MSLWVRLGLTLSLTIALLGAGLSWQAETAAREELEDAALRRLAAHAASLAATLARTPRDSWDRLVAERSALIDATSVLEDSAGAPGQAPFRLERTPNGLLASALVPVAPAASGSDFLFAGAAPAGAYLRMKLLAPDDGPARRRIRRRILGAAAASLAICWLALLMAARRFLGPLRRLESGLAAVMSGDFSARLPPSSLSDLAFLTDGFNRMAERLDDRAQAAAKLDAILNTLPDPVLVLDRERRVVTVNRAALGLLGKSYEDLAGRDFDGVCPASAGVELAPNLVEIRAPDGDAEFHMLSFSELPAGGFVVSCKNVTEFKDIERAERQARQAAEDTARFKAMLVATVSHELRDPLGGVLGMTRLLGQTDLSAAQRDLLSGIESSGAGLLALVNDILDYSKAESESLSFAAEPFRPAAAAEAVVGRYRGEAERKNLALSLSVEPDAAGTILGDERRWSQVLANLAANAVKFTETGRVEVELFLEPRDGGRFLAARVRDSGPGIAAEDLPRLFEPFYQSAGARARGGVGLGLAISKRLAEGMGGGLTAETSPGRGSSFTFLLPWRPCAPAPTPPPRRILPAGRLPFSGRALVVEDNPVNRTVACEYLRRLGFTTDAAGTVAEALRLAAERRHDLALLDLELPDGDGLTLSARLKSLRPELAMIVVSAHVFDDVRRRVQDAGIEGYLPKPLDFDELSRLLERRHKRFAVPDNPERSELLLLFRETAAGQLAVMERALAGRDEELLAREAHSLGGACLVVKATAAAAACRRLREAALRRDWEASAREVSALRAEIAACGRPRG